MFRLARRISTLAYSHTRNAEMRLYNDLVVYEIPIYTEKHDIGDIKCIYKKDDKIIIEYYTVEEIK
jgi:hypothetical protein